MRTRPSLRRRLLARLWIPLAGLFLGAALLSFAVALHFGDRVHDRWLLDSAMTLSTQLRATPGGVALDVPRAAIEMFEWDSIDRIYDEVTGASGATLFGNAQIPAARERAAVGHPRYYDATIDGVGVRSVEVVVPGPDGSRAPVTIRVAETRGKRHALIGEVMSLLVPLQAAILCAAAAIIWFAVRSGLAGVDDVASRLSRYDPVHLAPLPDVDAAPSEIRPLVVAINALIQRLADARGAQQRFVANAAHQLRTPLAALQVQTERALRETDPEHHAEALAHVLKAVTRMRRVTQQMLALTRSDATAADTLSMQPIDLGEVVRDELQCWADAAVARDIDLGYEGAESGPMTHGEPRLLRELVGNLVDNAIRYGDEGGEVTVSVGANPARIAVCDNGPGIDPAERTRVLDPFYRSPTSTGDGCGLGLTIAHEIAARHGARLTIGGHGARGTRIDVVFADAASAS
ncbi:MAG TPA: sensor histidine kinase N-terminal domain-containing protein [Casimicrobiaceae bacterium]